MEAKLYTVFDRKAGFYTPPFVQANRLAAIRAISDRVNHPESQYGRHAADYELYEVGTFEDQTCGISVYEKPEFVIQLLELIKVSKPS